MKTKSCLQGATIFGGAALILRLTQYILTIDEQGYYKRGLLADILGYGLIALLTLGTLWILICGFGGKKREVDFPALLGESTLAQICFLGLSALAILDGFRRLYPLIPTLRANPDYFGLIVAALCILGGIGWILVAFRSANGNCGLLNGLLPVLHLCAVLLDYFWTTYKYIHISEYILMTLGLAAVLLFVLAIMKPAGDGASTGHRICATAGLTVIFCGVAFLPQLVITLQRGIYLQDLIFFFSGILYLILALLTLTRLPKLPPAPIEEEEDENRADLSALYEYLSDLPEVEEDEETSSEE